MARQLDDYRLLGRSGLRVSPLALGTMTFGVKGSWGSSEADAQTMLGHYVDRGGNFIDTANFYAQGESERVLGRIVKDRRHRLVISTKYSMVMRPGDPNSSGNHRKSLVRSVEDSLARLDTDYIDLLYLHFLDPHTPLEETLRGLDDLVRAGKILYAGLSNLPAWQAARMQTIAELRAWAPLVALQIPYNLTERTVERDLMPMALEMGLGVLPWSPLAGGVLAGKYDAKDLVPKAPGEFGKMDSRKDINFMSGRLTERNLAIADVVKSVAEELESTPAQVALAWTMRHRAVVSPLIGVRTPDQLEGNLKALEIDLDVEQVERLDAISRVEFGFPHDFLSYGMRGLLGGFKVEARHVS